MSDVSALNYFDEASKCPACGSDDVRSRFRGPISQDPSWYDRKNHPEGKWPEAAYIHRTCRRCEYEWPEAPLTGSLDSRPEAS